MTATTMVPVNITPEAQARVEELGFQAQLARMIEHVRQVVPQLVSIEVEDFWRADEHGPSGVCIRAMTNMPWQETFKKPYDLGRWRVTTFPPEVLEHIVLTYGFVEEQHAG